MLGIQRLYRIPIAFIVALGAISIAHAQPALQCVEDVTTLTAHGEAHVERAATRVDIRSRFIERAQTSAAASEALCIHEMEAPSPRPVRAEALSATGPGRDGGTPSIEPGMVTDHARVTVVFSLESSE